MKPHFFLGPGDTRPAWEVELIPPNKPDGSRGDAPDLTGTTCTFMSQDAAGTSALFEATVTAVSPVATSGRVLVDLLVMSPAPVFVPGTDYHIRVRVNYPDGGQETFPNGPDPTDGQDATLTFFLLRVAPDFVAVGP